MLMLAIADSVSVSGATVLFEALLSWMVSLVQCAHKFWSGTEIWSFLETLRIIFGQKIKTKIKFRFFGRKLF